MPLPSDADLETLVSQPREDLHIGLKGWLDLSNSAGKSTLAKAIIAIANHGGGFVLIGFDDPAGEPARPASDRPANLENYSQDAVNGIVQAYAAPAFHCAVHHVGHPGSGDRFPVILVPGSHKVPIQAQKGSPDQRSLINGKYYIRRQGPQSAEPGTPDEWRELVTRCVRAGRDDLLDAIRDVLAGRAPEATAEPTVLEALLDWAGVGTDRWASLIPSDELGNPAVPRGFYRVAYAIDGRFPKPSLAVLRDVIDRSTSSTNHTGWPPWIVYQREGVSPYVIDGMLECDLGVAQGLLRSSPSHADFWRASPDGRLLLIRGLLEDAKFDNPPPGKYFSLTTPIWRAGECLLHAATMSSGIGVPDATVVFTMKWSGLRGRELKDFDSRRSIRDGYRARQDDIDLRITVPAASIDAALPEIVLDLLTPLYEIFDLFSLPRFMVEEELRTMRQHRF